MGHSQRHIRPKSFQIDKVDVLLERLHLTKSRTSATFTVRIFKKIAPIVGTAKILEAVLDQTLDVPAYKSVKMKKMFAAMSAKLSAHQADVVRETVADLNTAYDVAIRPSPNGKGYVIAAIANTKPVHWQM